MTTEDRDYKVTQYFTDDAVYYDFPADSANTDSGQVLASGVVNNFNLDSEGKLNVTYTPTDSDGNFYTSIYGDVVAYSFSDLYFDNIVGYKDETDDDVYYITYSQAVFTLAYISMIETSDSFYTDKARIEITDYDKREFTVSFDITNKTLNSSLGTYVAKFSGLNSTDIPAVDRFLNGGKNPTLQTKEEFKTVMEKFKAGNYSMNALTSSGLAKYYFTDKYFYEELFSNADSNIGYLKQDGHIYSFTIASNKITVDKSTDHAAGNSPMTLPGVGSSFFASDDLGYISHFSDEIYNYDSYEVATNSGITYWKNTTSGFSTKMFNYVFKNATSILPLGSGFIVSDSEDPFDTRVSLISAFRAADGSYDNYYEYTYYDIGNTSYRLIDDYLASL